MTQIRGGSQIIVNSISLDRLAKSSSDYQLIVGKTSAANPAYYSVGGDVTALMESTTFDLTVNSNAITPAKTSFYNDDVATPIWDFSTSSTSNPNTILNRRLTGVLNPIADQDAATKSYVDGLAQGLKIKAAAKVATIENITLSGLSFPGGIDGITLLVDGDRVLVKDQNTNSENGIWIAHSGSWTRATDMDTWSEVPGAYVYVQYGSAQSHTGWVCTSSIDGNTPGTIGLIGTDDITFEQFSGAGDYSHAAPITLTGNVFGFDHNTTSFAITAGKLAFKTGANGATDNSTLEVSSDSIRVKAGGITTTQVTTTTGQTLTRFNMNIGGTGSAGSFLMFDANGSGWTWHSSSDLRVVGAIATTQGSPHNVWIIAEEFALNDKESVYVNGVRQRRTTDYLVSEGVGNMFITFSDNLNSADIVLCDYEK